MNIDSDLTVNPNEDKFLSAFLLMINTAYCRRLRLLQY